MKYGNLFPDTKSAGVAPDDVRPQVESVHSSATLPKEFSVVSNWQCYILHCADNTLYTGITNNMEKRLAAHNTGNASKYTRARIPVMLAFVEDCVDKSSALKREIQIKKLSRVKKLALIGESNSRDQNKP